MEDLIQILFFLVIIGASLMDGVRRQRQKQKSAPPSRTQLPYEETEPDSFAMGQGAPGLDVEVDWSEGMPDVEHLEEEVEALEADTFGEKPASAEEITAEAMVPKDLWEEIRAMARGVPPAPPVVREPPVVPVQTKVSAERDDRIEQRRVDRKAADQAASVAAAQAALEAAETSRERLGLGGIEDLRRAVLLSEVLGTPRSLTHPEHLPMDHPKDPGAYPGV